MVTGGLFQVGEWTVLPELNQIQRAEEVQRLEPKVMDVLVYLLAHAGKVVPRDRLFQAIWPDTFVGDDALKYTIVALRKALGDDARHPAYIETITKRGYRLIAEVKPTGDLWTARFEIEQEVGRGTMGEVYRARDRLLKRCVALKFLRPELEEDETARQRFLREARSAAALSHPHICAVYDTGELNGRSFIAMEYAEGATLKRRLQLGPLSVVEAVRMAAQIAGGLQAAHQQGIIHRDITPSNILLNPDGQVKITDFGIAKRLKTGYARGSDWSGRLTKDGEILGSLPYISPEQLQGQEADVRTDLFSFGIVLYEAVTGMPPFAVSSCETATIGDILHRTPAPPSRLNPQVPEALSQIIERCLEKNRDLRYASARELLTDLRRLPGAEAEVDWPLSPRSSALQRVLHPPWWVIVAGVFVVLAGVVGVILWW